MAVAHDSRHADLPDGRRFAKDQLFGRVVEATIDKQVFS